MRIRSLRASLLACLALPALLCMLRQVQEQHEEGA